MLSNIHVHPTPKDNLLLYCKEWPTAIVGLLNILVIITTITTIIAITTVTVTVSTVARRVPIANKRDICSENVHIL